MNPLIIMRIVAVIALCLALAWIHHVIYQSGYDAADNAWEGKEAIATAEATQKKAEGDAKALEAERLIQKNFNQISNDHQKEVEKKNVQIENLKRDVRTGALQLSVAVANNKDRGAEQDKGAGTPSQPSGNERAELVPEVAESLVSIATDGDTALRERNECIRLYNTTKDEINK